ncbi:MAG: hypothetical protein ACE361_05490 [Aureliella sp.]
MSSKQTEDRVVAVALNRKRSEFGSAGMYFAYNGSGRIAKLRDAARQLNAAGDLSVMLAVLGRYRGTIHDRVWEVQEQDSGEEPEDDRAGSQMPEMRGGADDSASDPDSGGESGRRAR